MSRSIRSASASAGDGVRLRGLLSIFLTITLLLCVLLLRPFVPALTGAVLVALATRPMIRYLRRRLTSDTVIAALALTIVTACIVFPAGLILNAILRRLTAIATHLQRSSALSQIQGQLSATFFSLQQRYGVLRYLDGVDPATAVNKVLGFLSDTLLSFVGGSVSAITQIVMMLFVLFFWYRDEEHFRKRAIQFLPLSARDRRFLARRLRNLVRASVLGRSIVAAVQGILAWIAFLILGVPGASLLANATTVCSLIPAAGAVIVWLPVAVYLLLIHAWVKALLLFLIGTFVLSTVDNILFPILAGSRAHMNTAEMFLSVFGGIWLFGISGLVVGPLLWVTAEGLIAIWMRVREIPREGRSAL